MLQQKNPEDFVIATGKQFSIKHFINKVLVKLNMKIEWSGKGVNEKGKDKNGKTIIECSKKYFRPSEVDTLLGNPSKARKKLKWKAKTSLDQLIHEMIKYEIDSLK